MGFAVHDSRYTVYGKRLEAVKENRSVISVTIAACKFYSQLP
jgi:hypothetical protein